MSKKIDPNSVPTTIRFHIGDLITVTSGRTVSPTNRRGLYELVDYMTGVKHIRSDLFGEYLVRDAEVCKSVLLEIYPWLREISVPDSVINEETGRVFRDMVSAWYGSHHPLEFACARIPAR